MMIIRTNKKDRAIRQRAYEEGLNRGYELGWHYRQTEESNLGFIIGSKINEQIDDILKRKEMK